MTITDPNWISAATRKRLENEVAQLYRERDAASAEMIEQRRLGDLDNNDAYHRAVATLDQVNTRIERTHTVLATATTVTVDDGTAQPGSIVTVMFAHDQSDTDTFLLGMPEEHETGKMQVCSPESPLGRAVHNARRTDDCHYVLPNGKSCTATVLAITPYTG